MKLLFIILFVSFLSFAKDPSTLTWGFMTKQPSIMLPKFKPFLEYLEHNMADVGIKKAKIVPAGSIKEMVELIKAGEIDFWSDSPFPIIIVNHMTDTTIFLKQWRYGQEEYHSVIFTHKNSKIDTYSDMVGKTIAFESTYSSSAYHLPKLTLIDNGYSVVPKETILSDEQKKNTIFFVPSGSNDNTIMWVLFNKVDAGATSSGEYDDIPPNIKKNLKLIGRSFTIPRFLLLYRNSLPPKIRDKLTDVLLNMGKNKDGRSVLDNVLKAAKYQQIDEKATGQLNKIKSLMIHIENEIMGQ